MRDIKRELAYFLKNKYYVCLLILTAACSYGFRITHVAIGIDDTPFEYYFSEGLIVVVGRWVLFLLNKFLGFADFAPFFTDLAGVLLLLLAVTLWAVLFRRVFGETVPGWGYLVFACVFLSNPLISEVFTYFLHNGICIGYVCTAAALLWFHAGMEQKGRRAAGSFLCSALAVWVAIGCYESFAVVFLVGLLLMLWGSRISGQKTRMAVPVFIGGAVLAVSILLRSVMTFALIRIFDLGYLQSDAVQRSLSELSGWMFSPAGMADMVMAFKRLFVMYGVFGVAYLPIAVYVAAVALLGFYGIWAAVRRKDIWIFLYIPAILIASWLLVWVEGKVTLYRSCQFLPMFCAFGVLLALYAARGLIVRWKAAGWVAGILAAGLIFNQAADLNNWFYMDYRKYQSARETMLAVARELEEGYDITKPLLFTGTYEIPHAIIADAYVPIGSEKYWKMKRITDKLDEHLLEKYFRGNDVWVAQKPSLSVIQWGMSAFEGNKELINFLKMHGHSFQAMTDAVKMQEVSEASTGMPRWPKQGSIVEEEAYIVIHF